MYRRMPQKLSTDGEGVTEYVHNEYIILISLELWNTSKYTRIFKELITQNVSDCVYMIAVHVPVHKQDKCI